MGSSQQQQQTTLRPIAPRKVGSAFNGVPTAGMLKGLYGSKGPKTFGLIKGAKAGGKALGKMPMKTKMKTSTPSRAMVEKSIRRTMGH